MKALDIDESKFETFGNKGCQYVRPKKAEMHNPQCKHSNATHGYGSVLISILATNLWKTARTDSG